MTFYLAAARSASSAWGLLADRYGRGPVTLGGAALLIAGCLLSFAAWPLLGNRLAQGPRRMRQAP